MTVPSLDAVGTYVLLLCAPDSNVSSVECAPKFGIVSYSFRKTAAQRCSGVRQPTYD
jgi:hypothetical protein